MPSTWFPAIFHTLSSSITVLASVDVCVPCVACALCANSSLGLLLAFALPLTFSRESTCILSPSPAPSPFPADVVKDAPKCREE